MRRRKPEVKDIEIICKPKIVVRTDLFGGTSILERIDDFVFAVKELGTVLKGSPRIDKYCQLVINDIKLDLFIPDPPDYYRQYVIRTGSAEYVREFIGRGWNRRGWVGTPNGLRLREECENISTRSGNYKWKCVEKNPTLPPVWNSEQEFYDFIQVPYLDPEKRI